MPAIVYPLCAAVAWVTLLTRLGDLRRNPRDPALLALAGTLGFLGMAFTVGSPPVFNGLNAAAAHLGVPNLATLWIHCSVVAFSAIVQVLLLSWTTPAEHVWAKARWRLVGGGLAVTAMAVLFVVASVDKTTPDYLIQHVDQPAVAAYLLAYLTFFAIGLAEITRISHAAAKVVARPWLRRGLRLTTAGSVVGQGYTISRGADILGAQVGTDLYAWEPVAPLSAGIGALLVMVGLTMPAWGPRLTALAEGARCWRSYQQLHPLWIAVYRTVPEVVLEPPRSVWLDRALPWRVRYRLYRRLIEIQDGRLAVRRHIDPGLVAAATRHAARSGSRGDDERALVEALTLRHALRVRGDGLPESGTALDAPDTAGGADVSDELAWLVKVSRAFVRTKSVRLAGPDLAGSAIAGSAIAGPDLAGSEAERERTVT